MSPAAKMRGACCLLAILAAAHAVIAAADDALPYPSRPLRVIVPTAPAGAGDALAREAASRLSDALQVGVVVDNRAGASGLVGTEAAARAAPDGYTLLFATSATHVIAPIVTGAARFDPVADFEPVIPIGYAMSVILVRASLPATTFPSSSATRMRARASSPMPPRARDRRTISTPRCWRHSPACPFFTCPTAAPRTGIGRCWPTTSR